ncbi:MAG: hypothetical protein GY841_10215 [FCB group bacterium]|nr:hypothetical protein [FCB group bacterium]
MHLERQERTLAVALQAWLSNTYDKRTTKQLRVAAWGLDTDTTFSLSVVALLAQFDAVQKMAREVLSRE